MANTVWVIVKLGHASLTLFDAMADTATWHLKDYSDSRRRGLPLKVISFSAAISAYKKDGQLQRATPLLDAACTVGMSHYVGSFSAAISAFVKSEQWKSAVPLFDEMRARGWPPCM
eukprot:3004107-Karenia_brevis.AAC.1